MNIQEALATILPDTKDQIFMEALEDLKYAVELSTTCYNDHCAMWKPTNDSFTSNSDKEYEQAILEINEFVQEKLAQEENVA